MTKKVSPEKNGAARRPSRRIVIVDDHPLIRRGLERMIHSGDDGFAVCGEASNAAEGLAAIRKFKPDLAIVDISLADDDGISLTRRLKKEIPGVAVLILSMHEEADYAVRALDAGAMGYMSKHEAVERIGSALQQVLEGKRYLSPTIAAQLATTHQPMNGKIPGSSS